MIGDVAALQSPPIRRLLRYLLQLRDPDVVRVWLRELAPAVRRLLVSAGHGECVSSRWLLEVVAKTGDKRLLRYWQGAGLDEAASPELFRVESVLAKALKGGPSWIALVLEQFWRFQLRPTIERRAYRRLRVDARLKFDRAFIQKVARFLRDVHIANRTLADLDQPFVDTWLLRRPKTDRIFLRRFLAWAATSNVVTRGVEVPRRLETPADGIAMEKYRAIVRRALIDESLALSIRAAILLMSFFKEPVSHIACMRKTALTAQPAALLVRCSHGPALKAAGNVGSILTRLRQDARIYLFAHPTIPHAPISAQYLRAQLRPLCGGNLRQFRNASIRYILNDYEPAEVARIFGYSESFVHTWNTRLGAVSRAVKEYLSAATLSSSTSLGSNLFGAIEE